MKTRITLTIAPKISMRAKNFARRRGTSVSALVEQLLLEATAPKVEGHPSIGERAPFSTRWSGKIRLARKDDPRSQRLLEKYGLGTGQS